nr:hypothetical protein CFP56_28764 [Quercus suber]
MSTGLGADLPCALEMHAETGMLDKSCDMMSDSNLKPDPGGQYWSSILDSSSLPKPAQANNLHGDERLQNTAIKLHVAGQAPVMFDRRARLALKACICITYASR